MLAVYFLYVGLSFSLFVRHIYIYLDIFNYRNLAVLLKLWCLIHSFVSEHIETLEEIDVEYKELALRSGIEKWGRVPALGCEPTFISDLADAVIESLPYVGAMAVSNLEARQVPLYWNWIDVLYFIKHYCLEWILILYTLMVWLISYENSLWVLSEIYFIVNDTYVFKCIPHKR